MSQGVICLFPARHLILIELGRMYESNSGQKEFSTLVRSLARFLSAPCAATNLGGHVWLKRIRRRSSFLPSVISTRCPAGTFWKA